MPNALVRPPRDWPSISLRRWRRLENDVVKPFGGLKNMTVTQREVAHRCVGLLMQARIMEAQMMNGEKIDGFEYATVCGTALRFLDRINPTMAREFRAARAGPKPD